jgi:acetolactate synthase-1/2/3 large subunit
MGCGFPLAIGIAAAERELALLEGREAAPAVLITGDGSIGFFLAELDTVQRAGLKLTIIVSNDAMWGTEFHGQTLAYGRDVNTKLGTISYADIAAGFGMASVAVSDVTELRNAISETARSDAGPSLIDVTIDPLGGKARKLDPLLAMILFEDIAKDH